MKNTTLAIISVIFSIFWIILSIIALSADNEVPFFGTLIISQIWAATTILIGAINNE